MSPSTYWTGKGLADRSDGEEKVVLPYCGLGDYEAIGEPALVKRVSWGSVFGSGRSVGDRLFGSRPQRP